MGVDWEDVRRTARERFGVTAFRPGQRELIEGALEGKQQLGILPTGAGKSLCYQLPALFLPRATVVVSPLISLMQDQKDNLDQAEIPSAKYPRRDQCWLALQTLVQREREQGKSLSLKALAVASTIPERKLKVIVALLDSAGIVARGRSLRRLRDFATPDELEAFLRAYEERHKDDQDRLRTMMKYAQSPQCRTVFLRHYFGETDDTPCGHCDNCRASAGSNRVVE
jgi:superfamily II DNA helicase RecQ